MFIYLLLVFVLVIVLVNIISTMKPHYFLLYCEEDLSHAVVPAEDVVFKNIPKKGETVNFFYDSSSRRYQGEVIEIGGESSFYGLMLCVKP